MSDPTVFDKLQDLRDHFVLMTQDCDYQRRRASDAEAHAVRLQQDTQALTLALKVQNEKVAALEKQHNAACKLHDEVARAEKTRADKAESELADWRCENSREVSRARLIARYQRCALRIWMMFDSRIVDGPNTHTDPFPALEMLESYLDRNLIGLIPVPECAGGCSFTFKCGVWIEPCADGKNHHVDCPMGVAASKKAGIQR
jgi:hypothetical protein